MRNKATYFFLGFLVLLAGLFAYHFYAADRAEQTIDKSIQDIASRSGTGLTVDYSSIDVDPFSGDILISSINIIRNQDIQRAGSARFDLTYSDFLNFMVWGTKSGLKQIQTANLVLRDVSYTNRQTYLETKIDSLDILYGGNIWNLIVLAATPSPPQIRHSINASGTGFRLYQPEGGIGSVSADTLQAEGYFGKMTDNPDSLYHTISLKGITWEAPSSFRDKYRFFIQGFGYQADAIPFREAALSFGYAPGGELLLIREAMVNSELFTTTAQGSVYILSDQLEQAQLRNFSILIDQMSPRFQKFLQQAQQLLGLEIPGSEGNIRISLNGPLGDPRVSFQP